MTASSAAALTRAACALALALWPALVRAEERSEKSRVPKPDPLAAATAVEARVADEIARYVTLARPGPEHRWLEPLVGSWTVEIRWEAPGRQAASLVGTSENRWILDGRFLLCEAAVGDGPSRVEATTLYGYDQRQKRFFAIALSSLATQPLQLSGPYDPAAAGFLLSGRERDETTGAPLTYREQLSIESPNRHLLRLYYDSAGRTPLKVVESVYTRR